MDSITGMISKDDLRRMVSRAGFIEVFWRYLSHGRETRPRLSMGQAFEELDGQYYAEYGTHSWSNFDAFRIYLSRHRR